MLGDNIADVVFPPGVRFTDNRETAIHLITDTWKMEALPMDVVRLQMEKAKRLQTAKKCSAWDALK